jgi:hypothetical protein
MGAVWLRARAEMRARWRALFSAALLCGLVGAAVLATVAGARRTENAYPRFLERQKAHDIMVQDSSFFADIFWKVDFPALARIPYVESAVPIVLAFSDGNGQGDLPEGVFFVGSHDPGFGTAINRPVVVEGRLPDPTKADEIAVPLFAEDDLARFHTGDRKTIALHDKLVTVTVVGRTVFPGELPPTPQFGYPMFVTPAFLEQYSQDIDFSIPAMLLRFRERSDVARFERDVRGLTGGKIISPTEQESHARAVQGSTNLQASALRLLALFTALTGAMILGQLLARETTIGGEDSSILRALGFDRWQLFRLGILRILPVAITGAIITVGIAWIASAMFPLGSVRAVDPINGPVFDGSVLAIGGIAVAAAVMLLVLIPAWRASATARRTEGPSRPSRAAAAFSAFGMSVPAVAGARLALERGRGRSALPVYSSLVVVSLGIASFVAATTFGESLGFMIERPELHGKTWDSVVTTFDETGSGDPGVGSLEAGAALAADPSVEAIALADSGIPLRVFAPRGPARGIPVLGLALINLKGSMFSPITEGRAPAPDASEVVLGPRMIRALGIELDPNNPPTIELALQGADDRRISVRVVGRGIIPPLGNFGQLGFGVMLAGEGAIEPLVTDTSLIPPITDLIVRWGPGVDPAGVVARHKPRHPQLSIGDEISGGKFADAVSFGGVQGAPLAVGGVLAALGAAALAHVLVTAIRRRRRDVAILKTIGFVRGQARRVVAWQATITVLVATLVGVPLGVIGGRWLWSQVADGIGVLSRPQVNTLVLVLLLPAVIVLANLIAALPARSAARTPPALVLRSE